MTPRDENEETWRALALVAAILVAVVCCYHLAGPDQAEPQHTEARQ